MPEVLEFTYRASSDSIMVKIDPVREIDGKMITIVGGEPPPERQWILDGLDDADLVSDTRALMQRWHDKARKKTTADIADPKSLREEANRVARERQALIDGQIALAAATEAAAQKQAAAEEAAAAAMAEHDRITKEIEAKRADLAKEETNQ